MLVDLAWKARAQRESGDREVKCGTNAVGSSDTSGSNPAPIHQSTKQNLLDADLVAALKLLWFFLPNEEPYDPHTKKAAEKEKNKRWFEACNLYQKYVGRM